MADNKKVKRSYTTTGDVEEPLLEEKYFPCSEDSCTFMLTGEPPYTLSTNAQRNYDLFFVYEILDKEGHKKKMEVKITENLHLFNMKGYLKAKNVRHNILL